jgi:hypothetical protein
MLPGVDDNTSLTVPECELLSVRPVAEPLSSEVSEPPLDVES